MQDHKDYILLTPHRLGTKRPAFTVACGLDTFIGHFMLKETYFNQYKGWGEEVPPNARIINVMRTHGSVLAPSYDLLNDWKDHKIKWDEYTVRFIREIQGNPNAIKLMKEIKIESETKDIYLVCACFNKKRQCHRFILIDLINDL